MADQPTAVVVMAYGTPASADDIETYYTDIRGGRPPTAEQLADLRRRYHAIGGLSPLAQRTRAQVVALQAELDGRAPGHFKCWLGQKHAAPTIEDAAAAAAAQTDAIIGIVLAPHYSALSIQQYLDRLEAAAFARGVTEVVGIPSWSDSEPWIQAQGARVREALARAGGNAVEVLFTAHSLPERIVAMGDVYPAQLEESARLIAAAAGVATWRLAWQSAGRTPEPWLGPDLRDVIRDLARSGFTAAVVCPQGFTSDHLEVLYDIDIEAQAVAGEVGIRLERTESLNDDPQLIEALADAVTSVEL